MSVGVASALLSDIPDEAEFGTENNDKRATIRQVFMAESPWAKITGCI